MTNEEFLAQMVEQEHESAEASQQATLSKAPAERIEPRIPEVFREILPNGISGLNESTHAVVVSLCAIADELRIANELERERLDELKRSSGNNSNMFNQMIALQQQAARAFEPQMRLPPAVASTISHSCTCGHGIQVHDQTGCIVCDCKTFTEAKS
jgi:hypothetical protein